MADDLLRCELLDPSMTISDVEEQLGPADVGYTQRGHLYRDYEVGLQRDSFFQLDSELLSVEFELDGSFRSAFYYRG